MPIPAVYAVITEEVFRVFSCAVMAAPAKCNHSLPSVWSVCQWLLIRFLIGSWLIEQAQPIFSPEILRNLHQRGAFRLCRSGRQCCLPNLRERIHFVVSGAR